MATYLVSGVSSGIGAATARLLKKRGDSVIGMLRSASGSTSEFTPLVTDFANPEKVDSDLAKFKFPPISAFINCAGTTHSKAFYETTPSLIQNIFNVNVVTPMIIIKHLIPCLTEQSSIILLGSQSAMKGSHDDSYAASKGAVDSLVKSLSGKLAPKTRVINFSPGITHPTGLTEIMKPENLAKKKNEIPMKRFASPEEMAEIIVFLTSEHCRFMTGNTVDVNGGLVLR